MARKPSFRRSLPAEFRKLGDHFHRDVLLDVQTLPQLAAKLAGGFSEGERPPLRAFLTRPVESGSTEEVRRHWDAVCSDFWFEDGEWVRGLLAAIRDALGQGRTLPGWVPPSTGRTHGRRVGAPQTPLIVPPPAIAAGRKVC